jgi:hypothetical protein
MAMVAFLLVSMVKRSCVSRDQPQPWRGADNAGADPPLAHGLRVVRQRPHALRHHSGAS